MQIKTTFKMTEAEIVERNRANDTWSIYNISEIDLFDMVVDTRSAGVKLPDTLIEMINWACYHDMHFGGQFLMLTASEEFLDCLAWHGSLDD
jgi:maleate cis-trans isomerase